MATHRGVLVVDDEPFIRELVGRRLREEGFPVWTAGNGEEALDLCYRLGGQLAVVLLDVQMPGLDGPHTLERMRDLDAHVAVCFMTGDPGIYGPIDLMGLGARHVFAKPFRMREMVQAVRTLTDETVGHMHAQ
jgi:DNA-binding response OmpR family regulator